MLKDLQYQFYGVQEVRPQGWLRAQLKLQADGLNGNLDRIWPDVKDSAWIGGSAEGWERVPYWLDGFIPLAYLLDDADMICRGRRYIDAILARQQPDGWICPCSDSERGGYDLWAAFLILKVLTVYADCSGDDRISDAVSRALRNLSTHLNTHTLKNWGAARWFECLIPIFWLYRRTHEAWLLALARKLQLQGFDWNRFLDFIDDCTQTWGRDGWNYESHVVNVAMMLKAEALVSLMTDEPPTPHTEAALAYLAAHHGTATGHFNGDETLSGTLPINGTELCGVVEAMYSYEWLFAVTGGAQWLDRLENLAFNALPAAISPDMWTHQYDQMANQVAAFPMSKQPFRTNQYLAHTFGVEPEFGCCTANFGQGWPKLALSAFAKTRDGIASCALVPAELRTVWDGVPVSCTLETGYPFRDTLVYRVTADAPVRFVLSVRIPSCADGAWVDGQPAAAGAFVRIDRVWTGTTTVQIRLRFDAHIVPRPNDLVCVRRGPLVYAVAIDEKWEPVENNTMYARGYAHKFPYCDFYIYPQSKWAYALVGDQFDVETHDFASGFGNAVPPICLTAQMAEIPWGFHHGHCDPQPASRTPVGAPQLVRLAPYGHTNLRLTEFSYLPR